MVIEELNGRPLRLLIGGSPCFEAGTLILTKDGLKKIEDVNIGDLVYTHKNRYMPVVDLGNKEAEVYDLKVQGIYSTHVTLNHPYYTRDVKRYFPTVDGKRKNWRKLLEAKWETVEKLTDISYLSSPLIYESENPYNLTKEQCWILGRYVADGHIRHSKRLHRKNSYQYGVILSIGSHKLEYVKKKISTYHYSCYPHTKNTHRVVISNQNLVNFIINNDFGMGAENKNIPGIILNLPIESAKEFLDGYMSGDGCYIEDYEIHSATTISKRLAFSLALLVQKILKVNTSITYNIPKPTKLIEGREVNQKPQYIITYRSKIKKQTHAIIDNGDNKIWIPYKGKEYLKRTTVYNISVLEDESYVANNLVVHNCTHWSIAQKNNRETKPEGLGWELFKNYLIAKEKFKPDFFLYENNKSAAQQIKDQISKELCVDLQYINSALVSAQNRQRFYAHNIPGVEQPEDRGILLIDILESGATWLEKSYALSTKCNGAIISDTLKRHRHTMIEEPVCAAQRGRYNSEGKIVQRFEPRNGGKTNVITTVAKDNMVCKPVRIGDIGSTVQAHRVYSSFGKSVTINSGGGGQGSKTGLYIAPVFPFGTDTENKAHCVDANYYKGSNPKQTLNKHRRTMVAELTDFDLDKYENVVILESGNIEIDGKLIYRIKNGYICCKDDKYEIDLPDGYYTIRKLTPIECERLQTLPDNYTSCPGISNSQRYKMIGNGWTAEVIIHILSHINIPKDYPIEVLSMYDGIATGRYCLEKLGYTNITYKAYEIDEFAKKVAMKNYPDIIQCGDAFQVREDDWEY